jgi:glycine oxidase
VHARTGETVDIAILGGGVIGLAIAWRASRLDVSVAVVERDALAHGASHVAAGMLAPVSEVEFGEAGRRMLDLGLRSAEMWPDFAVQLAEESGVAVELHRTGTLLLARDADEARELERQIELRESLGLAVRQLRPSAVRELEPALAPGIRMALEAPDDHSVDPRVVAGALAAACQRGEVRLFEHAGAAAVLLEDGVLRGLRMADGSPLHARVVVLAAGAWSGAVEIRGLDESARPPVRPVKGQLLRLRDPAGGGLVSRALRYEGGYLLPRGDGRYVLGATVEEQGFNAARTAGAVHELLRQAWEVVPGIAEMEIEEICASFRPGTPDNLPLIGPSGVDRLIWATGHYRNGILLAPLTAELVVDALAGTVAA